MSAWGHQSKSLLQTEILNTVYIPMCECCVRSGDCGCIWLQADPIIISSCDCSQASVCVCVWVRVYASAFVHLCACVYILSAYESEKPPSLWTRQIPLLTSELLVWRGPAVPRLHLYSLHQGVRWHHIAHLSPAISFNPFDSRVCHTSGGLFRWCMQMYTHLITVNHDKTTGIA